MVEDHSGHVTEDFKIAQNNDFVINIFTNFYTKIRKNNDDQLRNFKDKINEVDKMVDNFFGDELMRVEKTTQELTKLLANLNSKVKKLVSMYQAKFKEEFVAIKEDYDKFQGEITTRNKNLFLFILNFF